jgi:hypothetical protein
MNNQDKGKLIGNIICALRVAAMLNKKAFDEGDTFFQLCFKDEKELIKIAKICGL